MTRRPHWVDALPRATRRGTLLGCAGAMLIVLGATTGFTDLVRAGVFALLLLLLALLLVALTSGRPAASTVMRFGPEAALCAGEDADIRVEAHLPNRVRFIDTQLVEPHTFVVSGRVSAPALPRTKLSYRVSPTHRGVFTSGPTRLENRDPLGLARSSRTIAAATEWIVWPMVRDLEASPSRAPGQGDDTASTIIPAQSGEPGASTRPYVHGDDTRLVHWPATAHRGELIIRQFDPPADDLVAVELVGDVPTPGTDDAWEALIVHVASLWRHLQASRRPAVLTVGDVTTHDLDAGLDALARAAACPSPETRAADVTTWTFVHTSADDLPHAPTHAEGHAVVAGEDAARADALGARMSDVGWIVHPVGPDASSAPADHSMHEEGAA